jgi:hypothetical protein
MSEKCVNMPEYKFKKFKQKRKKTKLLKYDVDEFIFNTNDYNQSGYLTLGQFRAATQNMPDELELEFFVPCLPEKGDKKSRKETYDVFNIQKVGYEMNEGFTSFGDYGSILLEAPRLPRIKYLKKYDSPHRKAKVIKRNVINIASKLQK